MLETEADFSDAISNCLYPAVFKDYARRFIKYGDVSNLPSMVFFYGMEEGEEIDFDLERGKKLYVSLTAISEPDEEGLRSVFFELNGQPRNIQIIDRKLAKPKEQKKQAEAGNDKHVGAPITGIIVGISVKKGDEISIGDDLFTVEAMKMQTIVKASSAGEVGEIYADVSSRIQTGELIVELK